MWSSIRPAGPLGVVRAAVEDQQTGLAATALRRLTRRRQRSLVVGAAVERVDRAALEVYVARLGEDASTVRSLDAAVEAALASVLSLSSLTAPLALDYLDRLARPIPALTPRVGVQIVSRAYVAHLVVESDPAAFGAAADPRILLADYDRLVVTSSGPDGTVCVLRPPGADPEVILLAARLVLAQDRWEELAGHLGMAPHGPRE